MSATAERIAAESQTPKISPSANPIASARFLSPQDEKWMIAIPLVGMVLSTAFWILSLFGIHLKIGSLGVLLSTLVFADSFHVTLNYFLILSVPELQAWSSADQARARSGWMKGLSLWSRALLVGLALASVLWFLKVSSFTVPLAGIASLWLFFELMGPAQHTVAQMKGISLCYNSAIRRRIKLSDAEVKIAQKNERIERVLFNFLLAGEVLFWIPEIFVKDQIHIPGIQHLHILGGAFTVVSAVGIVINSLFYPHQSKSHKFSFLLRVLLFPLKMLNIVGGIFVRAAHGTEYLMMYRQMVKGSKTPHVQKSKIFLTSILVSLAYLIPYLIGWNHNVRQFTGFDASDTLIVAALIGTFVIRFVHYYLDSVLFKMSDLHTRMHVAPLLTGEENPSNT